VPGDQCSIDTPGTHLPFIMSLRLEQTATTSRHDNTTVGYYSVQSDVTQSWGVNVCDIRAIRTGCERSVPPNVSKAPLVKRNFPGGRAGHLLALVGSVHQDYASCLTPLLRAKIPMLK
jgi:hypothetical protein